MKLLGELFVVLLVLSPFMLLVTHDFAQAGDLQTNVRPVKVDGPLPPPVVIEPPARDTMDTFACLNQGVMPMSFWKQDVGRIFLEASPPDGILVVDRSPTTPSNVIRNDGNCLSSDNDPGGIWIFLEEPGASGVSIRVERDSGKLAAVFFRSQEEIDSGVGWAMSETSPDIIDVSLGSDPPFLAVWIDGVLGRIDPYEWPF